MQDDLLLRYSRQIMLPELDVAGQQKLFDSTVLIVGLGGLGCPAAMYLAVAGVGNLVLADGDTVELSNLQRQIAHSQADLGRSKVQSAGACLEAMNPDLNITFLNRRMQDNDLEQAIIRADLVLDATDNFATRFAINRCCVKHRVPLVSGAAIRMEGQVSVFDAGQEHSPCYQCLYQEGEELDTNCASNGVMAPVVGIIGSVLAMEAIKLIANIGESLCGRLLLLDARYMQWRELKLPKDPACSLCGTN